MEFDMKMKIKVRQICNNICPQPGLLPDAVPYMEQSGKIKWYNNHYLEGFKGLENLFWCKTMEVLKEKGFRF